MKDTSFANKVWFKTRRSTLQECDVTSGAALIASESPAKQRQFLNSLNPEELRALPYLFDFWALPHQIPPKGNWRTWVVLGGRGAGKTRAGAEWIRSEVEGPGPNDKGRSKMVALVGETYDQARDVMVEGDSGVLACSPPDRRPEWIASRRELKWPNGAKAKVYSATDFEGLRGPQFDAAWLDELAKWPKGSDSLDQVQFALRMGENPRQVVTTTPRDVPILKRILALSSTVTTQAATRDNRANLASSFLEEVEATYGGTRLGRQELEGVLTEEIEGALWTPQILRGVTTTEVGALDRVVVAVDPPVTGTTRSDECGIVVAGIKSQGPPKDWQAFVLEDASIAGATPLEWAERAVEVFHRFKAARLVAEVNQGGDLVEAMLRQVDPTVSYKSVRAVAGKVSRAEPVAALYEQGRVKHVRGLVDLEEQMRLMTFTGYEGSGSPDRVDALVWALTELMIEPARAWRTPRIRELG
ncbi:MAG: terminase family protein [Boseongicola sp.]|nr:terminase family protein [Boseongicola sp.]